LQCSPKDKELLVPRSHKLAAIMYWVHHGEQGKPNSS
jgi:hypothetical protein